jgi:uncharacterized protein YqhQ
VEKPANDYTQYGGQALLEGVMMRSPHYFSVACRKPDGGIIVQAETVEKSIIGRLKWLNKPFLRGTLALLDAMALGMKAMGFASRVQMEGVSRGKTAQESTRNGTQDAGEPVHSETLPDMPPLEPLPATKNRINDITIGSTLVVAMLFSILLFKALPALSSQYAKSGLGIQQAAPLTLIEGAVRVLLFLGYITLISQMSGVRRVFQYHGAEHKAINTLEAGLPLTPENCLRASRIHPRCGTAFLIVVLGVSILVSLLVFSLFGRPDNYFIRLGIQLCLIPIEAGTAYEVIKFAGKYRSSVLMQALLAPGLWSQRLTTREPDLEHVEVALASLQAVLDLEHQHLSVPAERNETDPEPASAVA